jgi:hypothetical protein
MNSTKSESELRDFCEGYLQGALCQTDDLEDLDDWVTWGGYFINIFGSYYSLDITKPNELQVSAYLDKEDMTTLDDPIVSFTMKSKA